MELALIFVTGMLLSLHCVGMCGGFVALLAIRPLGITPTPPGVAVPSWSLVLPQQVVFNLGRVVTYTMLGTAAGALGSFGSLVSRTGRVQALLMVGAGVFMVASGLALAGVMRHWSMFKSTTASPRPWLKRGFEQALRLPRTLRALPLGALLGFLPCGLIYTMLGKAASTGSATSGALVMFAFGAGTMPALLLVAFFADLFTVSVRQKMVRVSGFFLALLGGITLYRGLLWLNADPVFMHHIHGMVIRSG